MLILLNKNNIILFLSIILLLMILFTNLGFYTYCKKNARKGYIIERQCFFMNTAVVALLFLTIIDDLSDSKHNFMSPDLFTIAIIFLITMLCVISVIVKSKRKGIQRTDK